MGHTIELKGPAGWAYLEEGQQVLDVGAVAQGSSGGLVGQPVEVLGSGEDGSGPVGQQAQQVGLTAGLHRLEPCQSPHCSCTPIARVASSMPIVQLSANLKIYFEGTSLYSLKVQPCLV